MTSTSSPSVCDVLMRFGVKLDHRYISQNRDIGEVIVVIESWSGIGFNLRRRTKSARPPDAPAFEHDQYPDGFYSVIVRYDGRRAQQIVQRNLDREDANTLARELSRSLAEAQYASVRDIEKAELISAYNTIKQQVRDALNDRAQGCPPKPWQPAYKNAMEVSLQHFKAGRFGSAMYAYCERPQYEVGCCNCRSCQLASHFLGALAKKS